MDIVEHSEGPNKRPLLSVVAVICEKVLREEDKVLSAIRIVDVFFVQFIPELPREKHSVQMQVLLMARFDPDDEAEHSFEMFLVRPDGDETRIGLGMKTKAMQDKSYPDHPAGINIVAPIQVLAKQMGAHQIKFVIDGDEVARQSFRLIEHKPETEPER